MGAITKSVIPASLLFSVFLLKATALSVLLLNITQTPVFPEEKQRKGKKKNLLPFPNSPFLFCLCTCQLLLQLEPSGQLQRLCRLLQCCQLKRRTPLCGSSHRRRAEQGGEGQTLLRQYRGLVPPWPRLGMLPQPSYILCLGIWVTQEMLRVSLAEAYWKEEKKEKKRSYNKLIQENHILCSTKTKLMK